MSPGETPSYSGSQTLKPSNDRCEFELDWARRNKNMADTSFALGHETDLSPPNLLSSVFVVYFNFQIASISFKVGANDV